MKTFKFNSSSSAKVYTVKLNDDGTTSCDCMGWTVKKLNKPRMCKHTTEVERNNKTTFVPATPKAIAEAVVANEPSVTNFKKAVKEVASVGGFVNPMLASKMPTGKTADSFSPAEYVMEEKFDGHRLVVRVENGKARAWSRLGNERKLPSHIAAIMNDLPTGVYDGELIVPSSQHSYAVTDLSNAGSEALVLFDMIEVDGHSIAKESNKVRVEFLKVALENVEGRIVYQAQQFAPTLKAVKAIWARGGEGAIIKKTSAPYRVGYRSPDWIKVKAIAAETLTIIGFEAGKNGPHSAITLRDDSGVETTVKTLDNETLREIAKNPTTWIGKRLVISYQEKTPSGSYRHPMFDHLAGEGE
jgi:ATP-dependent DNA ligase